MMRVARLVPTMMVAALVAGCGGGQTGDLSGENGKNGGTTGSTDGCEEQLREISLDDSSALGFDAASVLSFAEQPFQTDLAWQALDHVEYSPSASQSTLTLTLTSQSKAWFVRSVPAASTDGQGEGVLLERSCPPDRLRLAVRAQVQSADGALNESFDGMLEARSRSVATLREWFDPKTVSGSFEITHVTPLDAVGPATAKVEDLNFSAVLTPAGMAGSITSTLSSKGAQVSSGSSLLFARFPSDTSCSFDPGSIGTGVPVSSGSVALGQSGAEAMTRVNAQGALALAWNDGAHSALTLELSQLNDGCIQVASTVGYEDPTLPPATAVFPVTLKATTADGRWQGQYPASLATWPNADGSGFSQRVELNKTFVADQLAATGFGQAAIPTGSQRLTVRFESAFEAGNATGQVSLQALKDPPCVTNPEPPSGNSAPGCSGTEVTTVLGATWPE